MASESGGEILKVGLLAVAAYFVYEWFLAPAAAAPATTAAATTPAVNSSGAYTTALTSQPVSPVVPAPVSTAIPPATAPATAPAPPPAVTPAPVVPPVVPPATGNGSCTASACTCSVAADNTMASALQVLAAGDPAMSNGLMTGWDWDWFVVNKMNGPSIGLSTAPGLSSMMTACDYVALRAQQGQSTGLSGMARFNTALTWKVRDTGYYR